MIDVGVDDGKNMSSESSGDVAGLALECAKKAEKSNEYNRQSSLRNVHRVKYYQITGFE